MSDTPSIPQRRCTKCKQAFPATLEYFMKRSANRSGLGCWCKTCAHAYNHTPAAKRSKKQYALSPAGRATTAKANEKRKPKRNEYDNEYNATPKAHLARKSYNKSDKAKASHKRYLATPKGLLGAKTRQVRYKAKKRTLPNDFTLQDWQRALDYFGGCCAICGRPPGLWHTLAADHWIPLSNTNCPGTVVTNIIPLCHGIGGCNNSKHNKLPLDWLIKSFGKRKANMIYGRITEYFNSVNRNG